ncbi:hypothetical protein ACLKA6_014844 [Drosophila palustris]
MFVPRSDCSRAGPSADSGNSTPCLSLNLSGGGSSSSGSYPPLVRRSNVDNYQALRSPQLVDRQQQQKQQQQKQQQQLRQRQRQQQQQQRKQKKRRQLR